MRIRFSTRRSRDPARQYAATMKRADSKPVTAPMAETNRAVVRPAVTRRRTSRQRRGARPATRGNRASLRRSLLPCCPATSAIAMARGRRKMRKERESGSAACSAEPRSCRVARSPCQAVLAIQWLWSLSRLWVAATNRHSDCAAALPLRMNRSIAPVVFDLPVDRLDRDLALRVELAAALGGELVGASARRGRAPSRGVCPRASSRRVGPAPRSRAR